MTPSWMSGYVGDVTYTLGFYRELAPSFLNYVCVINGFGGITKTGGLRYCELGCGRGYSTTLLAAANPDCEFVGIDFNPAHISEACDFAARAGIANITFRELSFADAARSTDAATTDFDVVAMHGVYTWVSREVRENLHEFLRTRLLPGGVAFVSYNVLPGWSAAAPLQRILKEYADRSTGDSLQRVAQGREVLKMLAEKSSLFFAQNPAAKRRLDILNKQSPHYIAHEFLNQTWEPLYFTEAMSALAEAKLTHVGSASIAENRLALAVPKDLVEFVQAAPDRILRELLKDFASNKQFRRDVYVKGPTRISGDDLQRRYDEIAFALITTPEPIPDRWRVPAGEATVRKEALAEIVSLLQKGPANGAELRAIGTRLAIADNEVPVMLEILIHNGVVSPCRADFASIDRSASDRVNLAVLDLALVDDTHRFLAAPVLGSAIGASYVERVAAPVVAAEADEDDASLAAKVFDRLDLHRKKFMRGSKALERSGESIAEMASVVRQIKLVSLPRWRGLGVLE